MNIELKRFFYLSKKLRQRRQFHEKVVDYTKIIADLHDSYKDDISFWSEGSPGKTTEDFISVM